MSQNKELAQKWLLRAKSSFNKAKIKEIDEILFEDLCFDAQQAAEKALKSILVAIGIEVPRTHSIGFLIKLLYDNKIVVSDEIKELSILTDYAVQTRYPGDYEPITEYDYKLAVKLAYRAIVFAENIIEDSNLFS